MNLKNALKRIEELERKVKELETRPMLEYHFHTHNPAPLYQPLLPVLPVYPTWLTYPSYPYITYGAGNTTEGCMLGPLAS